MKQTFAIIALISILFTSCTFTEEITFDKNFKGTYNLGVDMSKLMSLKGDHKQDSIPSKKIDSVINFRDILEQKKDSISKLSDEEKEKIEALKDLRMEMHIDEAANKMAMNFLLDFESLEDLKGINKKLSQANDLNSKKSKPNKNFTPNSEVEYSFKGNTFKRVSIAKELTPELKEKNDTFLTQSAAILEGSTYKIIYHFPKKIKSVSVENAQISEDKKTVTIISNLGAIFKDPKSLDFEVKLKN
ncbi:hypothetical protein SAMN05444411_101806 [Lutibacter oricola]|uniref:Lipoprotein n=1 Tax=Lutibacter oricola TaxID=762486 RepID=A0A1H2TTQ2_9FLAO|nr:hypothetical protein [Lutibacter oricola]SDW47323.1 hypothetical protein SAMN05444411_101806 [Lutibacter oricola]